MLSLITVPIPCGPVHHCQHHSAHSTWQSVCWYLPTWLVVKFPCDLFSPVNYYFLNVMMSYDVLGKTQLTWLETHLEDCPVLPFHLVGTSLITPGFEMYTQQVSWLSVAFYFNFIQPVSVRKDSHVTSIHIELIQLFYAEWIHWPSTIMCSWRISVFFYFRAGVNVFFETRFLTEPAPADLEFTCPARCFLFLVHLENTEFLCL